MASTLRNPPAESRWRSRVIRDQAFASAIGLVLLGISALCLNQLGGQRTQLVREDPDSEKTLGSLAVTFPRLTLGGMRGIASTYLWIQAEDDKNNRKWMELESKYTLIGALQPYFSSVYIYHAWNQAYNISAQWQEEEIKYKWVTDGLAYLYKGEDFNPANPDIMYEESQLYAMKLGGATERIFYRQHWRNDIGRLHELNNTLTAKNDDTVALQHVRYFVNHRDARDPVPLTYDELKPKSLTELKELSKKEGLPFETNSTSADLINQYIEKMGSGSYFHTRELPDPDNRIAGTGWGIAISDPTNPQATNTNGRWGPIGFNLFKDRDDGKKATDPVIFRYGVSPFYFAYSEFRRTLDLPVGPTYVSTRVIDAWPAMSLRLWCRDDLYYSYDTMRQLFGNTPDKNLLNNQAAFNRRVADIHDSFRNIQMIAPRSAELFSFHLDPNREPNYAYDASIHTKHRYEVLAYKEIAKAENRLFDTLVQWHLNGRKLDPDGKIRSGLLQADALYKQAYPVTLEWVEKIYPLAENNPDRAEFEKYANALQSHSRGIAALIQSMDNNQTPDMSFLEDEIVER